MSRWPLFGLRLTSRDLELRPVTGNDLDPLADLLPDDLELDPAATRFAVDDRTNRGIISMQGYWRSMGTWRTDAWRLPFAVRSGGELIGVQELKGYDFPLLRTVDSSSYLVRSARGRGWGRQMRAAVLALAFGPMEAQEAITSAWHDNHASLGVSRALGYQPNGEHRHARAVHADGTPFAAGVDQLVHLRLSRAAWLAGGPHDDLAVEGFEPCRALFGLG